MGFRKRYAELKHQAEVKESDLAVLTRGLKSKDMVQTVKRTRREAVFAMEKVREIIRDAYNSETALGAMKVLEQCRQDPDYILQVEDYVPVASFLVFKILQTNAQRVSVIIGLTLKEFSEATPVSIPEKPDDDRVMISVTEHKTGDQAPAVLILGRQFYRQLRCFVRHVRPLCYAADELLNRPGDTVFINMTNSSGAPKAENLQQTKDTSTVNKWLKTISPLSATILRKASTINARQKAPEKAGKIAKFLNHSQATADRYYVLGDRVQHAPEVHLLIGETMGTGDVLDTDQWRQADEEQDPTTSSTTEEANRRM